MTTKRIVRLITAALWTALTMPCLAVPSPPQSGEPLLGFAQWRNLFSNSGFPSSYWLPSGCVTKTAGFSNNLGLSGFGVGPDCAFIWTPEKRYSGRKARSGWSTASSTARKRAR
jgi:hypothetical protein